MRLVVNHTPIPKKRHRHGKKGGYDSQSKEKHQLKWHFAGQMRENDFKRFSRVPLHVAVYCYSPIPKSLTEAKKKALEGKFNMKKPDADNLFKFYTDVLNGIAYEDDNLISSMICQKRYSSEPRVEIEINQIEELPITQKKEVFK